MAHNVIPILSASPPPMDGFEDWGDDDEFGGFETAPSFKLEASPQGKPTLVTSNGDQSDESLNQANNTSQSSKTIENNGEPVPVQKQNGVAVHAENVDTPSHESVVDSGWGSDVSPLTKSEEFGEFGSGLAADDMTSLTAISREDSASSSLVGEFKRSDSELVLPEISNLACDDDNEDGLNNDSDSPVKFDNNEIDDDWGAFSDSVPECSPEEETPKPLTDDSEWEPEAICIESKSSHDQNAKTFDVPVDGVTDDCSNSDAHQESVVSSSEASVDLPSENITSGAVTSAKTSEILCEETTSVNASVTLEVREDVASQEEEDDWFANIRDEAESSTDPDPTHPNDEVEVTVELNANVSDNNALNESSTDSNVSETEQKEVVHDSQRETADDSLTVDESTGNDVVKDVDWDPFNEDVADVAPVSMEWSAFGSSDNAAVSRSDDWAAFGAFGESSTDDVQETDDGKDESDVSNKHNQEITNQTGTEAPNIEAEIEPDGAVEDDATVPKQDTKVPDDDFGNFKDDEQDDFGDFGEANDDDFGDFEEGDFGEFDEPKPPATEPTVINEQLKPAGLAKLSAVVVPCFPDADEAEEVEDDLPEESLREFLEKPREEVTEKIVSNKTETETVDRNIWNRLMDVDKTPECMKISYRNSKMFHQVLKVLDIDPRNILNAKKPSVPVFASNLGLLEPSKPSEETSKSDPSPSATLPPTTTSSSGDQGENNIPPVEFDWSGAGLTNPLDSSQPGIALDLDFFIDTANKPAVQTKSSALENEFLSPIDLPTKKKSLTLDSILGNAKFTSVKKEKIENISSEAKKVLENIPDISFMTAKVLMFPIRSTENSD